MNRRYGIMCLGLVMVLCAASLEARMEVYDPRSDGREPANYAWWVAMEFKPTDTVIEGIPVKQIHSDWVRASVFTKDAIPAKAVQEDAGRDIMAEARVVFSCDGDFNDDGTPDRALVGTYQDSRGAFGQFLLILSRDGAKRWKVLFVNPVPGKPGFSALRPKAKKLEWWFCLDCGDATVVSWDAGKKRFRLR